MPTHGHVEVVESASKFRLRDLINDLEEGARPPSFKITAKFEAVLGQAFAHTQAQTHIISGSLKASGHTSSDFDGDTWSGTVAYGGPLWASPVPGPPHDPVDYAIYEKARGGAHDFFSGLEVYEQEFERIINEFFPG